MKKDTENKNEEMEMKKNQNLENDENWDKKATDELEEWIEEQGIQLRY
ncbi:MAG: hypothetical protein PHC41_05985 [Lachnospiraceae bacterium]|jgi:hypothetical protein|nr:hypothetical protein [Lachnospiraceae bacterium]MDD3615762.1 hypothetical protein [Lachnospiraceae bacterium]